jgi:predicted DsbA family dithiol-disulfide isomerase
LFPDLNNSGKLELDFFLDIRCPYAYQSALWIQEVANIYGEDLDLRWRFFSLEQINRKEPDWNIWEQNPDLVNSLWFFLVAAAVLKKYGQAGLGRFYLAAGKALHERGQNISDKQTLIDAAINAGIDPRVLEAVFTGEDTSGYEFLKNEHSFAVDNYGTFGVPTLVFEERDAVYLKMMPKPSSDRALEVFQHVLLSVMVDKNVIELKRPMTPAQNEEHRAVIKSIRNIVAQ